MKRLKLIFNKLESIVLVFCILCVFSMLIFQGFFRDNSNSVFLNFNQLEPKISYDSDMEKEFGYVVIKLEHEEFSDIDILINGDRKYEFGKNAEIKLKVHNNDMIVIDSSMYGKSTKIKVVGISKNIIFPKLNTEITTNSNLDVLGSVILN